jgi:metal-responsive CopG/Arc/MetJ family transcriptional regulator
VATIQVVIDDRLLEAADKLARRNRMNRSALFREALRTYLKRQHYRELERREREAYEKRPDDVKEVAVWERVAVWPDD